MIAWLHWNPPREAFTVPILNHPVMWYGILFAAGFALAYLVLVSIMKVALARGQKDPGEANHLVDRLLWYAIIGTLIGARLGNAIFYEPAFYLANPLEIFMVWHGGLASHGGAVGILIAIALYYRKYKNSLPGGTFLAFFDLFTIPIPIAGAFIRFGNFVNQEILGTPSTLPWAIVFEHPAGREAVLPRHPVMLYEAFAYLILFALLYVLWRKKGANLKQGLISGLFLTLLFSSRFILEFFKVKQADFTLIPGLDMGQILSIPFILWGLALILKSPNKNTIINY